MKTAICISGIPRFWDQFPKHLFSGDYFIHTWNVQTDIKSDCFTKYDHQDNWSNFDRLIEYFQPKQSIIENFDRDKQLFFREKTCLHPDGNHRGSVYPMFFSIMKSIELVPAGYSHIVRCRFDTRVSEQIVPEDGFWIPSDGDFYGINDQFAYGDIDAMRYYSKTYESIVPPCELIPERILQNHMAAFRINRIKQRIWLQRHD